MNIVHFTTDITVFQLRAARRALNISMRDLAVITGVSPDALVRMEKGDLYSPPPKSHPNTIFKIRVYLEKLGIQFLDNNSIRLSTPEENIRFRIKEPLSQIEK